MEAEQLEYLLKTNDLTDFTINLLFKNNLDQLRCQLTTP